MTSNYQQIGVASSAYRAVTGPVNVPTWRGG
jgi:hypothetical protein